MRNVSILLTQPSDIGGNRCDLCVTQSIAESRIIYFHHRYAVHRLEMPLTELRCTPPIDLQFGKPARSFPWPVGE